MIKILVRVLFLICIPSIGFSGILIGSGATGGGSPANDCQSADYMFYWTGDNDGGCTVACVNNGLSELDTSATGGTIECNVAYGDGGSEKGIRIEAADEYYEWTVSSNDIFDHELGTLCMKIYPVNDGSDAAIEQWEATEEPYDANDYVQGQLTSGRTLLMRYRDNGETTNNETFSGETAPEDTWTTICYAWDAANDAASGVSCGTDDDCTGDAWTDTVMVTGQVGPDMDRLRLGNLKLSYSHGDDYYVTDMIVFDSYKRTGSFPSDW